MKTLLHAVLEAKCAQITSPQSAHPRSGAMFDLIEVLSKPNMVPTRLQISVLHIEASLGRDIVSIWRSTEPSRSGLPACCYLRSMCRKVVALRNRKFVAVSHEFVSVRRNIVFGGLHDTIH